MTVALGGEPYPTAILARMGNPPRCVMWCGSACVKAGPHRLQTVCVGICSGCQRPGPYGALCAKAYCCQQVQAKHQQQTVCGMLEACAIGCASWRIGAQQIHCCMPIADICMSLCTSTCGCLPLPYGGSTDVCSLWTRAVLLRESFMLVASCHQGCDGCGVLLSMLKALLHC